MVSNSPLSDIPVSREKVKRDIPAIMTRQLSQVNGIMGLNSNTIIEEERSINADQIEIEPKKY